LNNITSEKEQIIHGLKSNYVYVKENLEKQNKIDEFNTYIQKDLSKRNTILFFTITSLLFLTPIFTEKDRIFSILFMALYVAGFLSVGFFIIMLLCRPLFRIYRFKKKRESINDELEVIKRNFIEIDKNNILPEKYLNEYSVRKLIEYFENLRADTLKEAINLLEAEKIQNQQLSKLNYLIDNQNKTIHNQREIIENQNQLNSLVKWNTIFK